MGTSDAIATKLERVAEKLIERGDADLAEELQTVLQDLRQEGEPPVALQVLTTGQAAAMLGVRSVFTIKRWAREGILDGFRRGGRILVTRESVERLLHSPKLADERAIDADLEALDASDEPVPVTSWPGQRPWEAKSQRAVNESEEK